MIKNLTGGWGVTVSGGSTGDPYISPGAAGAGMVRWNPNMNCLEVNDGNMWKHFTYSYPTIELTPEVRSIIEWAKQKRQEEMELDELAKTNPTIADLQKQIKEKKEQIDIVRSLTQMEVKIG